MKDVLAVWLMWQLMIIGASSSFIYIEKSNGKYRCETKPITDFKDKVTVVVIGVAMPLIYFLPDRNKVCD